MEFKVRTSGSYYDKEHADSLTALGFQFTHCKLGIIGTHQWEKANEQVVTVNIDTIEELLAFVKVHGPIIFDRTSIEIYDDYRE